MEIKVPKTKMVYITLLSRLCVLCNHPSNLAVEYPLVK